MNLRQSFGWVGALSLVGVILSFCSQLVFSYFFGATSALDAYWVAFAIMNLLSFPVLGFREALVSEIHHQSLNNSEKVSVYFSKALSLILIVALVAAFIGIFFSGQLIELISSRQDALFQLQVLEKLLWLAPALILLALSDTLNALMTSYNKVVWQMLSRVLAAGSTVVIIALAANWIGSQALVLGFVIGQLINVILLVGVLHRQGLIFKPSIPSDFSINYFKLSGALCFSYGINQLYAVYEKSIILSFGTGLVSAFQYSVSITNIVITVLGISLTNILWPRFLGHVAKQNNQNFYAEAALGSKLLFLILGWICALIFLHAQWLVQTIFARGAFGVEAISLTTLCLQMTIFAAIPASINIVLARAMLSAKASKNIILIGFVTAFLGTVVLFLSQRFQEPRLAMSFWLIANLLGCVLSGILFMRQTQSTVSTFQATIFWLLRYIAAVLISIAFAHEFLADLSISSNFQLLDIAFQSILFTLLYLTLMIFTGLFKNLPLARLMGRA